MLLENVLTAYGLAPHPYVGTNSLYPSGDSRFITTTVGPGYLITLTRQLTTRQHNPCCKALPCPPPTDTTTIPVGEGQALITGGEPWYPRTGTGISLYTHVDPFNFRYENTIDVPPYWAGALLAKGCSTNGEVAVPIPSRSHYDVMEGYNTQFYYLDRVPRAALPTDHPCYTGSSIKASTMPGVYGFISRLIYEEDRPELSLDLEAIGILGIPWSRAFIPSNYQHAVYWERLAFLRGVMDYRGTITDKGVAQLFVTSRRMLEDCHYLVRRLGGYTDITTCGCCEDPCGWLVDILLPNGESPFHVTPEDYVPPSIVTIPPWVVTDIRTSTEPISVGKVSPGTSYFIYPDVLVSIV